MDRWFDSAVTGFVIDPSRDCPVIEDGGDGDYVENESVQVNIDEGIS